MPSPFPGMDPYLESDLWSSFHGPFACEIAKQLNRQLRDKYVVLANRRLMSDDTEEVTISLTDRRPDVSVVHEAAARTYGNATTIPPLKLAAVVWDTLPHYTVEVRDVRHKELIT